MNKKTDDEQNITLVNTKNFSLDTPLKSPEEPIQGGTNMQECLYMAIHTTIEQSVDKMDAIHKNNNEHQKIKNPSNKI